MTIIFFDREDSENDLNGTTIRNDEQLSKVLEGLRVRAPFVCELVGDSSFHLHVGVGEVGHAQYSRLDGEPPYLMAVAPHPNEREQYTEFLLGGTPTPISSRYCMPFELVRKIAEYFLETGRAHPGFTWEEV